MTTSRVARPRLGVGLILLLVLISLANVATLGLLVLEWVDVTSHGASLDDDGMGLFVTAVVLSVVALVGIAGAWLRHKWGPRLYLAVQLIAFLVLLATMAIGPLSFLPLILAGVLFRIGERDW